MRRSPLPPSSRVPASRRIVAAALTGLLGVAACSSSDADPGDTGGKGGTSVAPSTTAPRETVDLTGAGAAAFEAHGSVEQIWLTGAGAGTALELVAADDTLVAKGHADEQGSYVFRGVPAGDGYRVAAEAGGGGGLTATEPFDVPGPEDHPPADSYDGKDVNPGYGYLETRDGTLLAINVLLPGPVEEGPYPTVVEYSGYSPADPDEAQPGTMIASALGFAVVGVNMRGTGCSGGTYQFFETLQSTDGYDVIETIAAQPWVKGGKVGMVGVSYPGISQLFVAQTRPPHLAAITPLSVIADTARGILYPGGIFNNGFAKEWAEERAHDAEAGGQAWSQKRMDEGDEVCRANQALRGQTPDIMEMIEDNRYWTDEVAASLAPELFVARIEVPVFMAGTWQDEQTGGYFPNMIDDFAGNDRAWFTITNGGHVDSLDPEIFARWAAFLAIYVAEEVPEVSGAAEAILGGLGAAVFGTSLTLPPDRFAGVASLEEARGIFEEDPRVRVLFESGAGAEPGAPVPAFEEGFDAWPVEEVEATPWYLDADGVLVPETPAVEGADQYRYDPSRSQATTIDGGQEAPWRADAVWNWPGPEAGTALAYETAPLDADVVMVGGGSVDLWLRSSAADTDLQVTLSEVRADGKETFVQTGWLRASQRALDESATELRPLHTQREEDAAPLPAGEPVLTRVELFPFAHAFRAGSKVRIVIDAPGGTRALWKFDALPAEGDQVNTVARGGEQGSRVVLPVVPGLEAPTDLPPCPGLRSQPCRDYATVENTPAG